MRVSLFWRTFLLIAPLTIVSVLSAMQLVRVFDQSPPDRQLAWEISSVLNLTRSALVNSFGERRQGLLVELARDEGVRVIPLETGDRIEPLSIVDPSRAQLARAVETRLRAAFGNATHLAGRVNGEDGLWVSFDIDEDAYWLRLDLVRFDRQTDPNWTLVAAMTVAMAGLGALAISQLVNRPLARLAGAIERISRGEQPERLPDNVPSEIAAVNRRFNRLAGDLAALESDRAVGLAGISHDIRTPLARLRLEIELSQLPEGDKASMAQEIERVDQIVGQFLEYGRAASADPARSRAEPVDIGSALQQLASRYGNRVIAGELQLSLDATPGLTWTGDPLDLTRILGNLVENALRYGRTPGQPYAQVSIRAARDRRAMTLQVADAGAGVPPDQFERLLRPFARLDSARSSHQGGSGLGLAIVARIARRYDGECELAAAPGGGLLVRLSLRDATGVQ